MILPRVFTKGFVGYRKSNREDVPDTKVYWADGDVFHMANAEIEGISKFKKAELINEIVRKTPEETEPEEKNEIQYLFERRNGLSELAKILTPDNDTLYEKLVKDMGETGSKFQNWWDTMAKKYQWESTPNGNWEIDFDTCDIYLVDKISKIKIPVLKIKSVSWSCK